VFELLLLLLLSRTITRICDRCRGCIVEQGSVIEVKAGILRGQLPEALDLCEDCSALFADWLKSGHHAAHVEPGSGIPVALDWLATPPAQAI
jgi:hypothetical protein